MKYASTAIVGENEIAVVVLPLSQVSGFDPENPPQENTYGVPDSVEVGWIKRPDDTWAPPVPTTDEIISSMTKQIQRRLDEFAKTRNYDGILSACTYATSTVPKFQAEGQYCVNARDATWAAAYTILAEVQNGQRPVPASIADFVDNLPALDWPS